MATNVEIDEFFLRRSEERVKLLRAGFSGKEIEALYVIINHVEVIGVSWQDLSIKLDRDCAAALTNEELDRIMDRMPCYRCHPLIRWTLCSASAAGKERNMARRVCDMDSYSLFLLCEDLHLKWLYFWFFGIPERCQTCP